jgi:hypothetical protein
MLGGEAHSKTHQASSAGGHPQFRQEGIPSLDRRGSPVQAGGYPQFSAPATEQQRATGCQAFPCSILSLNHAHTTSPKTA